MNEIPTSPDSSVPHLEAPSAAPNPGGGGAAASMETGGRAARAPMGNGGRGFWALIVTQFQGAFSDNTLKWLTTYLIMQMALPLDQRELLMTIVTLLFTVPFILFSMTGGFLADRFSKRRVVLGVKVFEIFVMSLVLFSLASRHLYLTIFCVFLMAVHSAIFGPSKYGLLPELLPEKKLSSWNSAPSSPSSAARLQGACCARPLPRSPAGPA